ncbi:MAG: hypothetical protein OXD30_03130 [Bryobacterales bacterium]|nr:hypothetical protein [Bryobacterales bacterium]
MTRFRILYLAADAVDAFRSKTPSKPPFVLRRSHYQAGPEVDAESSYGLWHTLRAQSEAGKPGSPRPIGVGDALAAPGSLLLCNYWGFDAAEWFNGGECDGCAADDSTGTGRSAQQPRSDA